MIYQALNTIALGLSIVQILVLAVGLVVWICEPKEDKNATVAHPWRYM